MRAILVVALAGAMTGSISGCAAQTNNDSPQARKAIKELLSDGYSMPASAGSGGGNRALDNLRYKEPAPDRQMATEQGAASINAQDLSSPSGNPSATIDRPRSGSDIPHCDQVGELAFAVMRNRQIELPMQRMMAIAGDSDIGRILVKMAYARPAYSAEENRQRAAREFQNMAYMACLDSEEKRAAGLRK